MLLNKPQNGLRKPTLPQCQRFRPAGAHGSVPWYDYIREGRRHYNERQEKDHYHELQVLLHWHAVVSRTKGDEQCEDLIPLWYKT